MGFTFRKDNPERPPDWRWQRASELLAAESVPNRVGGRVDDAQVVQAREFKRRVDACRTDDDHAELYDALPHAYRAWDLYREKEANYFKMEMEARLLTKEPLGHIAGRLGVTITQLKLYENWFFNVRDKLDNKSYIVHRVISKVLSTHLKPGDTDALWKLYAYFGGPYMLDRIVYTCNASREPESQSEVDMFLREEKKSFWELKASISGRTMPMGYMDHNNIMQLYLEMMKLEQAQESAGQGVSRDTMMNNIAAFLDGTPWKRQGHGTIKEHTIDAEFDRGPLSIRAEQLDELPSAEDHQKLLETYKYPKRSNEDGNQQAK